MPTYRVYLARPKTPVSHWDYVTTVASVRTEQIAISRAYEQWLVSSPDPKPPALKDCRTWAKLVTTRLKPDFVSSDQQTQDTQLYGILYNQLIQGALGLSPQNFQLGVASMSWDWATQNPGFIGADQYDFCSTMPQWSAVGSYVSSGASFDTSYNQFLNDLAMTTTDTQKQAAITAAQEQLTTDGGKLQTVYAQAQQTYNDTITGNDPSFTDWLSEAAGASYGAQISSLQQVVQSDTAALNALLAELTNRNLQPALDAFANTDFYSGLVTTGLQKFPAVPDWIVSATPESWIQAPGSPMTVEFGMSSQSYDFSQTWAEGAGGIGTFFEVFADSSWSSVTEFYNDAELQVKIQCDAMSIVQIQPAKWYSGTQALAAGPYVPGCGADSSSTEATYMFGEGGVLPVMNTGMLVCLNPSITVSCSLDTYQSFQQNYQGAGGIAIGPFEIGGAGGSQQINWTSNGNSASFTVADTTNVPKILGVTVAVQPSS